MSRILDYDPFSGVTTTFDYHEDTDTTVIGYTSDAEAVIEDNKAAMQNVDRHKKQAQEEWAHYAKVPVGVQYEWLLKHGVNFWNRDHWKKVMQLINSPEYKYLKRTTYYHDR